jgi:hypothetical protein
MPRHPVPLPHLPHIVVPPPHTRGSACPSCLALPSVVSAPSSSTAAAPPPAQGWLRAVSCAVSRAALSRPPLRPPPLPPALRRRDRALAWAGYRLPLPGSASCLPPRHGGCWCRGGWRRRLPDLACPAAAPLVHTETCRSSPVCPRSASSLVPWPAAARVGSAPIPRPTGSAARCFASAGPRAPGEARAHARGGAARLRPSVAPWR